MEINPMRIFSILTLLLLCLHCEAQQTFTDYIQSRGSRRGRVTLTQDAAIANLVNGAKAKRDVSVNDIIDEYGGESTSVHHSTQRIKMNGYRIQVYSGGNSRTSKREAEGAGYRARGILAGESVYTNFMSPRWVCRVGDYRSYEEAYRALTELKGAGFRDAVIVKSKVQVPVD